MRFDRFALTCALREANDEVAVARGEAEQIGVVRPVAEIGCAVLLDRQQQGPGQESCAQKPGHGGCVGVAAARVGLLGANWTHAERQREREHGGACRSS